MAKNELRASSSGTQIGPNVSESNQFPKHKKVSIVVDSKAWETIQSHCMKLYGTCYGVLGNEVSKAIISHVKAADRHKSFTIFSSTIHLGRISRMRLNAVIDAIAKAAGEHRSIILSHNTVSEVIRNTVKANSNSTIKRYITMLLQHGMEVSDTSSIEVLYDVRAFVGVPGDKSRFKDINRTKTSCIVEDAGQHSQDEDRQQPEKRDCRSERG